MSAVNVYERMARIQDALFDLEKVESLASVGNTAARHSSEVAPDMPNLLHIIETLVREARENVNALAEEVREATKPAEQPAPVVADKAKRKGRR